MARVYVGVGSNIDKRFHVMKVLQELNCEFGELLISPIYQTTAEGFEGEDFYNLVVGLESDYTPQEMYRRLRELEALHMRIRMSQSQFISRTLDLDQLMYADCVINEKHINLPNPDILQYPFVLKPLYDIAPQLIHPVAQQSIEQLWQQFDKTDMSLQRVELELS